MENDPNALTSKLAQLQAKYIAQFQRRFGDVEAALSCLTPQKFSPEKDEALKKLEHLTHKLAGSGATYGFPKISEAAKEIERLCIQIRTTDQGVTTQHIEHLGKLVQNLALADPS